MINENTNAQMQIYGKIALNYKLIIVFRIVPLLVQNAFKNMANCINLNFHFKPRSFRF